MPSSNPTVRQSARDAGLLAHAGAARDQIQRGTERQEACCGHNDVLRLGCRSIEMSRPPSLDASHNGAIADAPALPELDLAPFMAAPDSRARPRARRAFTRRLSRAGILLSHGPRRAAGARCRGDGARRASSSRCPRPSAARSPSRNSPHFRGYTVLGGEITKGVNDWREQLDVGAEEPATAVAPGDPPWRRLRGPNQWPATAARDAADGARLDARDGPRRSRCAARARFGTSPGAESLRRRRAAARRSALEDHPLPRAATRRQHRPRRRHAPRFGPRVVRAARRRGRPASRARRNAHRRDAEARHLCR